MRTIVFGFFLTDTKFFYRTSFDVADIFDAVDRRDYKNYYYCSATDDNNRPVFIIRIVRNRIFVMRTRFFFFFFIIHFFVWLYRERDSLYESYRITDSNRPQ